MNTKTVKPSNRHNATSLQSIEVSKYTASKDVNIDPIAYSLQLLLVSHYDGSSKSGVLNPLVARVLHQLQLSEEEFAVALGRLLHTGQWQIATSGDSADMVINWHKLTPQEVLMHLRSRGVHNIVEFTPLFLDAVSDAKDALKKKRVALNHLKFLTRYTGMKAGLGQALQTSVATLIQPSYQDLGYNHYRKQGITPKFQLPNQNGQLRKLCHSVWFEHEIMGAKTEDKWAYLFSLTAPTENMMQKTKTVTITMKDIATKFALKRPFANIMQAVTDINEAGWFHVDIVDGYHSNSGMDSLHFTPLPKLHKAVWSLERQPGGDRISLWEIENGHVPTNELIEGNDAMSNLPKLGYHWIYATKSHKTGEFLTVGQTTVSLRTRLAQHKTFGTNGAVHGRIEAINNDPEDQLLIEPIGLVHHSVTAEYEMRALWKMREKGHRMYNVLDDIERNRSTIFLDARLQAMPVWDQIDILNKGLEESGAVIFQNELPEVKVNH